MTDAAVYAHDKLAGKNDHAGKPKIMHCVRVADMALRLGCKDFDAAVLHDVIEDGGVTADDLLAAGFTPTTVATVQLLTNEGDSYSTYIQRVVQGGNRDALLIKLADWMDNTNIMRMSYLPLDVQHGLLQKYHGVDVLLKEALDA